MLVRWVVSSLVGLIFAGLVLLPFHARVGGIEVKCGAPAIAVSVPYVPEQCRPTAQLRLGAAVLGLLLAAATVRRRRGSLLGPRLGGQGSRPAHDVQEGD